MFYNCSKIKLSTTQTGAYQNAYRVPFSGTGTDATSALNSMFTSTGGSFKDTPTINTIYYTSNDVILPSGEVEVGNCIHFSSPNEFCLKANTKGWNGTLEYRTTDTWATWDGSAIVANTLDEVYPNVAELGENAENFVRNEVSIEGVDALDESEADSAALLVIESFLDTLDVSQFIL